MNILFEKGILTKLWNIPLILLSVYKILWNKNIINIFLRNLRDSQNLGQKTELEIFVRGILCVIFRLCEMQNIISL